MHYSEYDIAICLCVDYRYRKDFPRVKALLKERGTEVIPWVDGKGQILPPQVYNQFSPTPPPQWTLGAGAYAHFHGMKNIIRHAKEQGARHLLFLEDDLIFTEDADEKLNLALQQIEEHNQDWDILYYGANHTDAVTQTLAPNVLRVFGSFTTHCMGIRESIYDAILELPEIHVIDNVIANSLHHQYRCLSVWPNIALQQPGHSYLWNQKTNYTDLFLNKGRNT